MSDIYAHHRHATGDVKILAKGCKKKNIAISNVCGSDDA